MIELSVRIVNLTALVLDVQRQRNDIELLSSLDPDQCAAELRRRAQQRRQRKSRQPPNYFDQQLLKRMLERRQQTS